MREDGREHRVVFHPLVEARHDHDRLDGVVTQRPFELVLGVDGVQRRDDGANLPGAQFGDEELRAIREQQADPVTP